MLFKYVGPLIMIIYVCRKSIKGNRGPTTTETMRARDYSVNCSLSHQHRRENLNHTFLSGLLYRTILQLNITIQEVCVCLACGPF